MGLFLILIGVYLSVWWLQDSNGWLLDGRAGLVSAESPFMMECMALLDAFNYAIDNQLDEVAVEYDNLTLVNCVEKKYIAPEWGCEILIKNILEKRKLIQPLSLVDSQRSKFSS